MKEFLNEFIQLDKNGAFDNIKSEAQVKSSKKQEGKEITEAEFKEAMDNPAKFVDFVLSGRFKSKNINELLKKEQDLLTEEASSSSLRASERTGDVNDLALSYETKGGNDLWKNFGADEAIKQMKNDKMLDRLIASKSKNYEGAPEGFIDKVYAELLPHIRNYKPERQNESGLFGWINPQIANKATAVYNREYKKSEIDQKSKRLSDKVDKEGNREFDVADKGAREVVESAGEGRSTAPVETDRQVSVFEGRQAKAKEKQIVDIFKGLTGVDLVNRSKKGLGGTPTEELTKVAELLFDLKDGSKVTNLSKSSYPSVDLVNPKTGKKLTPAQIKKGVKGIIDSKDFVNIRDYFKDVNNLDRYLKTMPEYNITGDRSRINDKGETIEVSGDVKGKGLRLTDRVYDYFYEPFINHPSKPGYNPKLVQTTPGGRSKGKSTQPFVKRLKPEFRGKISPEVIKKLREDLLLDTKVEDLIKVYDRTKHGQLIKGMAKLETMKVANEATRKRLPKDSELDKKLTADTRAGSSDFAASEQANTKAREEIRKKIIPRSFVGEMKGMATWIKDFAKDMD